MPKEEMRTASRKMFSGSNTKGKTHIDVGVPKSMKGHNVWGNEFHVLFTSEKEQDGNGYPRQIRVHDSGLIFDGETTREAFIRIVRLNGKWAEEAMGIVKINEKWVEGAVEKAEDSMAAFKNLKRAIYWTRGVISVSKNPYMPFSVEEAKSPDAMSIAGRHAVDVARRRLKIMVEGEDEIGIIWHDLPGITTNNHNHTDKEKIMAKTMYDSHIDGQCNSTPIFMLEDEHLERIISGKSKRFSLIRAKMSDEPKNADPMIAAMGKSQKWSAEDLQAHTRETLNELSPYIQEALVRGTNSLTQSCIDAMRLIAKREERVEPPAEVPAIELESDEEGF